MTQIIQPNPETGHELYMLPESNTSPPWSPALAGKVSQALTVRSVQGQSAYKCQEMKDWQGSDKVECHKVP